MLDVRKCPNPLGILRLLNPVELTGTNPLGLLRLLNPLHCFTKSVAVEIGDRPFIALTKHVQSCVIDNLYFVVYMCPC